MISPSNLMIFCDELLCLHKFNHFCVTLHALSMQIYSHVFLLFKPFLSRLHWWPNSFPFIFFSCLVEEYGDILSTSLGRTTNPIEPPAPPPPQVPVSTPENSDMAELFRKLGLDKYTDLFLQQEVCACQNRKCCPPTYFWKLIIPVETSQTTFGVPLSLHIIW